MGVAGSGSLGDDVVQFHTVGLSCFQGHEEAFGGGLLGIIHL